MSRNGAVGVHPSPPPVGGWYWKLPWEMTMLQPQEANGSLVDDLSADELVGLANGLKGKE